MVNIQGTSAYMVIVSDKTMVRRNLIEASKSYHQH